MEKLKIYENADFGKIRTLTINEVPWFVGKDIADCLGYQNGSRDINRHVLEDDRCKTMVFDGNQSKETIIVNESGLYSLILGSKLPTAKKFKRWVTSEVLPSIRKHGAYLTNEKAYDITHNPQGLADLLLQAGEQLKQKEIIIQEMKPKALFADAVEASETSILVGDLAKLIKQNGADIGQKRLFEWLRNNGFLIKSGESRNMPTQKAMELRLFEVKERTISNPDGSIRTTKTTKVTGKGQVYFVKKFIGKDK